MAEAFIVSHSVSSGGEYVGFSFTPQQHTVGFDELIGCQAFCFTAKFASSGGSYDNTALDLYYSKDSGLRYNVVSGGKVKTITSYLGFSPDTGVIGVASPYQISQGTMYVGYIIK